MKIYLPLAFIWRLTRLRPVVVIIVLGAASERLLAVAPGGRRCYKQVDD